MAPGAAAHKECRAEQPALAAGAFLDRGPPHSSAATTCRFRYSEASPWITPTRGCLCALSSFCSPP